MTIYLLAGNRIATLTIPTWLIVLAIGVAIGLSAKPLIKRFKSVKWQTWFWGVSK